MKILSSSPYATFNPKEWNSLSRANCGFSNTPIKIKKKFCGTYKNVKSTKNIEENNERTRQIQLAFT